MCRYYSISGSCKFQETCSYLHKNEQNEKTKELKKEIENLKVDINVLTTKVDKLKETITFLSKVSFSKPVLPESSVVGSKNTSISSMSISLTPINEANFSTTPSLDVIPQLDGLQPEHVHSLPQDIFSQPLVCETCQKVFKNIEEYNEHDLLQFCCDDCGICYSTQVQADLHVLQVHPDEMYAREFIPESTKLLFRSAAM